MKRREWNGSFTVEASIYMPMLLLLYLFVMRGGMDLYLETTETAVQIQNQEQVDVKKLFYGKEDLGEMLEHGD